MLKYFVIICLTISIINGYLINIPQFASSLAIIKENLNQSKLKIKKNYKLPEL